MRRRFDRFGRAVAAATLVLAWAGPLVVAPAAAAGAEGGLALTTVDPAGTVLVGGCFELYADAGAGALGTLVANGKRCDLAVLDKPGANDGISDGSLAWASLKDGGYVLHQVLTVALPATSARYETIRDTAVTITAGAVTRVRLVFRPTAGLTIHKVDDAGQPLPGACFTLTAPDGRQQGICDGPHAGTPSDNVADGLLVLPSLAPEGKPVTYTLKEIIAPPGYVAGATQSVVADPFRPTELTIRNTLGAEGGLALATVDPAGTVLVGGCFELYADAGAGALGTLVANGKRCDLAVLDKPGANDGISDGSLAWASLKDGGYVLHQVLTVALPATSARYETIRDTAVTITAGAVTRVRLVFRPTAGLTIHKVDDAGQPLPGACFTLTAPDGRQQGICDGPHAGTPSDNVADGLLVLPSLAPEGKPVTYTLKEIIAPPGYVAGATQSVVADPFRPTELTIRNTLGADGGLALTTVDPAGTVLVGGCFELYADAGAGALGTLVANGKRCDLAVLDKPGANDGISDGSLAWASLKDGGYVLHQVLTVALPATSARYETIRDTAVTITAGAVTRVRLVFRPTAGLTIHKVDDAGQPLPGACFTLTAPDGRQQGICDGPHAGTPSDNVADGLLVLPSLAPEGKPVTYTLKEIIAPPGYVAGATQSVVADPFRPTELTIRNTLGGGTSTGGGTPIIGLELEIDSAIDITTFQGAPADASRTSAAGQIALTGDAAAGWHGTGTLVSVTNLHTAASCQTTTVTGDGTYDWLVSSVHAGPNVPADAIAVEMDSGPITENPDTIAIDICGTPLDPSTMNTWENLFFGVYSKTHYTGNGFKVDGWKAVGGPEVWISGGVVAEVTWTGSCDPTFGLECKDQTTFRLNAVVVGTTSASAAPGATSGLPSETKAGSTPGPTEGPAAVDALFACPDVMSCLTSPGGLVIGGVILLSVVGGSLVIRSRGGTGSPPKVEGPTLAATATDVAIEPISISAPESIDFERITTAEPQTVADGEKLPTEFDKRP